MVKNIRVDGIDGDCRKIGEFEWALFKVLISLLPGCMVGVDTVSPRNLPWPEIVKQGM